MTPTKQQIEAAAESNYPPQPGKHWVRVLRNARVESFTAGAEWALQQNRWIPVEERLPEIRKDESDQRFSVKLFLFDGETVSEGCYYFPTEKFSKVCTHYFQIPLPPIPPQQ